MQLVYIAPSSKHCKASELQVPNIKRVGQLSILEVAQRLYDLQQLAEQGHLRQEDLEGMSPALLQLKLYCQSPLTLSLSACSIIAKKA